MTATFLSEAAAVLVPARMLIALWVLLGAAHGLAAQHSPAAWGPGSKLSPRLLRALAIGEAGLAITMAVTSSVTILVLCLALLLVSRGALLLVTGAFWADGSEKMGMIAMAGTLGIAVGVGVGDPAVALAGALFTGGQVAMCYAVAGISKLPVPAWRDGSALAAVMASRAFGHPGAARALRRHPQAALVASWIVIAAEAALPLALIAPRGWLVGALGVMLAFHVGTAILMGLNRFPWAFAAAYPATLLLGAAVRGAIA